MIYDKWKARLVRAFSLWCRPFEIRTLALNHHLPTSLPFVANKSNSTKPEKGMVIAVCCFHSES